MRTSRAGNRRLICASGLYSHRKAHVSRVIFLNSDPEKASYSPS
jgi:hypothetical protein